MLIYMQIWGQTASAYVSLLEKSIIGNCFETDNTFKLNVLYYKFCFHVSYHSLQIPKEELHNIFVLTYYHEINIYCSVMA